MDIGCNQYQGSPILGAQSLQKDQSIAQAADMAHNQAALVLSRLNVLCSRIEGAGQNGVPEEPKPVMPIVPTLRHCYESLQKAEQLIAVLERKLFG